MTRMLNVNGTPAYLLAVASLEPRTPDELLELVCTRHPELLSVDSSVARNTVLYLTRTGLLARGGKPYRYTITPAGAAELNRLHDERVRRGAA